MSIRETIETADPCNVCDLRSPGLRRTCESLGRCDTRDAWARIRYEAECSPFLCDIVDALDRGSGRSEDDEHAD